MPSTLSHVLLIRSREESEVVLGHLQQYFRVGQHQQVLPKVDLDVLVVRAMSEPSKPSHTTESVSTMLDLSSSRQFFTMSGLAQLQLLALVHSLGPNVRR